ncbi:MAG: hypothetical protein ACI88C_003335, partial [Acidimicrobiales bacterium]
PTLGWQPRRLVLIQTGNDPATHVPISLIAAAP